jgi:hypothetical protein
MECVFVSSTAIEFKSAGDDLLEPEDIMKRWTSIEHLRSALQKFQDLSKGWEIRSSNWNS